MSDLFQRPVLKENKKEINCETPHSGNELWALRCHYRKSDVIRKSSNKSQIGSERSSSRDQRDALRSNCGQALASEMYPTTFEENEH